MFFSFDRHVFEFHLKKESIRNTYSSKAMVYVLIHDTGKSIL